MFSISAQAMPRAKCDRALISKQGFPHARYVFDLGGKTGVITLFRGISGKYKRNFVSPYFQSQFGHYSYSLHPEIVMPYHYTDLEERSREPGGLGVEEAKQLKMYRSQTVLIAQQNILNDHLKRPGLELMFDQEPKPLSSRTRIFDQLNEHLELLVHHTEENVIQTISLGEFYQAFQSLGEEFSAEDLINAVKLRIQRRSGKTR
jgi:hypothetical protein